MYFNIWEYLSRDVLENHKPTIVKDIYIIILEVLAVWETKIKRGELKQYKLYKPWVQSTIMSATELLPSSAVGQDWILAHDPALGQLQNHSEVAAFFPPIPLHRNQEASKIMHFFLYLI